jgi:hypothetical protein
MILGQYIAALVTCLETCDPDAYDRMCRVVGERVARIQLDDQSVYIRMQDRILQVESTPYPGGHENGGEGATDTATVLALLRGDLEVSEAILNGSLAVSGDIDKVNRMLLAIEILLDTSPRCPPLQKLKEQFVEETGSCGPFKESPRANWYPFAVTSKEIEILDRNGLLPR